jgi:hypothetical protein
MDSKGSQPPAIAPTEPDSRPITLTASPEQAILPIESPAKTDASPEKPAQGPNDRLLAASQIQAPAASPATSPASQPQALTAPPKYGDVSKSC